MQYPPRIGRVFGRLTVVSKIDTDRYLCQCTCGNTKSVAWDNLSRGHTKSCGCLRGAIAAGAKRVHSQYGVKKHELYETWRTMIRRCYDQGHARYPDYGGRGITVCDQWQKDFWQFIDDMGPKPSEFHTLDRKDNNGNYEPGNCQWATHLEQAVNKRGVSAVKMDGVMMSRAEALRRLGVAQKAQGNRTPAQSVAYLTLRNRLAKKQAKGQSIDWSKVESMIPAAMQKLKLEDV